MDYLPSIVLGTALLAAIAIIIMRSKSALWAWLFVLEILVLFECVGNCFVPGSWKQFWQIEIPAFLIAIIAAITSSILQAREERTSNHTALPAAWKTPQMLGLYAVLFIVAALLAMHLL